jgi:autotransporter-associated beta strand protein
MVYGANEFYCIIENEQGTLNLDTSGAQFEEDVINDAELIINVPDAYNEWYWNNISGSGSLTKNGEGTLYVYNFNDTGEITVNAGILMYWANNQWVQWVS